MADRLTVYSVSMFDGDMPRFAVFEDLNAARQQAWDWHRELEGEWGEVFDGYEELAEEIPIWKGQGTAIGYGGGKNPDGWLMLGKCGLRLGDDG